MVARRTRNITLNVRCLTCFHILKPCPMLISSLLKCAAEAVATTFKRSGGYVVRLHLFSTEMRMISATPLRPSNFFFTCRETSSGLSCFKYGEE